MSKLDGPAFPERAVVVDDMDSGIIYVGNWTTMTNNSITQNAQGITGPAQNGTVHGAMSNGTSATYSFNGTYVQALGTISTGNSTPTFSCLIDSNPNIFPQTYPAPGNPLCVADNLTPGQHTITITPSIPSDGSPLWIDAFLYVPLSEQGLNSQVVEVQSFDTASVVYGGSWDQGQTGIRDSAAMALKTGSNCTFSFNGTSVTLFSILSHATPNTASYLIDGGNPITITIPSGTAENVGDSQFSMPLFTSATLSPGTHNVTVTLTGNNSAGVAPLIVEYFQFITNPNSALNSTQSSASPISSSNPPNTASPAPNAHHSNTAAIVGGSVGGVCGLIFMVLLLYFIHKRRRYHDGINQMPPIDPFTSSTFMSQASSRRMSSGWGKANTSNDLSSTTSGTRAVDGKSDAASHAPIEIRHEDSGLRLIPEADLEPEIVEIPPDYTPS